MVKPTHNELAAGIFVVVALVIFLFFLAWVGGGFERMFAEEVTAVTYFHNIGALKENVQVTFQGIPIGEVEKITYDPEKKLIQVRMTLMKNFEFNGREVPFDFAGKRAAAMITQATFLGDQYIEITTDLDYVDVSQLILGKPVVEEIEDEVLLFDSVNPASIGMIMAQANGILRDIRGLTGQFGGYGDSIGRLLTNAEQAAAGAHLLIGDEAFRRNVHTAAANARSASAQLPTIMTNARELTESGKRTAASFERTASTVEGAVTEKKEEIASIIDNASELTLNARVLSYGLATKPWMLVWKDKEWQNRVESRDPTLLEASLRKPGAVDTRTVTQPSRTIRNKTSSGTAYGF